MELLPRYTSNHTPTALWADVYTVGKGQLTTEQFPFDLDTTSLGLTVTRADRVIASSVIDEMLEYVDTDGIIQV